MGLSRKEWGGSAKTSGAGGKLHKGESGGRWKLGAADRKEGIRKGRAEKSSTQKHLTKKSEQTSVGAQRRRAVRGGGKIDRRGGGSIMKASQTFPKTDQ